MQKSKTTSTPQKPKIQKSKATSTSQRPKLKKNKKGSSPLLENTIQASKRNGGRISPKKYRKICGEFTLSMIRWNALPFFIFIVGFLAFCGRNPNDDGDAHTILVAAIICIIAVIIGLTANIIMLIIKWRNMMDAQIRRINDLGWNGARVFFTIGAFTFINLFCAARFAENRILFYVILLPCVLCLLILQGLLLFKKGQAIPNKYGLPCNDDN